MTPHGLHDTLIAKACAWLAGTRRMHVVIPELAVWGNRESPDVLAYRSTLREEGDRVHTELVECKASRADFLADRGKSFRLKPEEGMGRFRWMFVPEGLVKPSECPEGWGLVEARALRPRVVRTSAVFARNRDAETVLIVAALRRLTHLDGRFPPVHFVARETPAALRRAERDRLQAEREAQAVAGAQVAT